MLIAACRPIRAILEPYLLHHKLVKQHTARDPKTSIVTFRWCAPTKQWRSAVQLWGDMHAEYLSLLEFVHGRIERQMLYTAWG